MDSGVFFSNKKMALSWILVPLLSLAIVYSIYRRVESVQAPLVEEISFIRSLSAINQKISKAEEMLKSYNFGISRGEAIEMVNSRLRHTASLADFNIDSLNVGRPAQAAGSASLLTVAVKGSGTLNSIASFIEIAQSSGMLLVVDSVNIRSSGASAARTYSAYFTLSYNNLQ